MARARRAYFPSHPAGNKWGNKRQDDAIARGFDSVDRRLAAIESATGVSATGGSTTSSGSLWRPDLPPATPHDYDEEFETEELPNGWGDWDVDGNTTATFAQHHMHLLQTTHAGDSIAGIYRVLPFSAGTITAKCSLQARSANFGVCLLGLSLTSLGSAPSTADLYTLELARSATDGSHHVITQRWNSYNSYNSDIGTGQDVFGTVAYLRIVFDGTDYQGWWSTDGIGWYRQATTTLAGAPVDVFLAVNNANTGGNVIARFDFVRFTTSTDPYAMLEGALG